MREPESHLRDQYGTAVIDEQGLTGVVKRYKQYMKPAYQPGLVFVQLNNPPDTRWLRWYRADQLERLDDAGLPYTPKTLPQQQERWI